MWNLLTRTSQQGQPWYRMQINAKQGDADVYIYDAIGWGGVTASQFAKDLGAIDTKSITVRINTPGGDVFDGLAIYNSLKSHGADIHVKVDGVAASIGSVIAMAGKTIAMGQSSFMMIHSPWAMAIGNAQDMREMAGTLDKIGDSLATVYTTRAGVTKEQAMAWMSGETWLNADDAVAAGLADQIDHAAQVENRSKFDLSGYTNVPKALVEQADSIQPDQAMMQRAAIMRKRYALVQRGESSR